MPVIKSADAVVHELAGNRFTAFAAPARGSAELCAWRVDIPAGTTGLPHTVGREEVLLVLGGTMSAEINGERFEVTEGDVIVVPAGASFGLDNVSDEQGSVWASTSVGFEAELADGTRLAPPWVQ